MAHTGPSIPNVRGVGSRPRHTGWFCPPGAAAEAGVAAGILGGRATALCPQCHHSGDLLPPPSPSPTWLNALPLFPAQRQRTPLLPLPGAGPYARPSGGPPAAPRLGQGHLRSLPERDGCPGRTDKAGRRQPRKRQHAPVVLRYGRKTTCGGWERRRRLHRHRHRRVCGVGGAEPLFVPCPRCSRLLCGWGAIGGRGRAAQGCHIAGTGVPGCRGRSAGCPPRHPPPAPGAEPAGPCLIKPQILIH